MFTFFLLLPLIICVYFVYQLIRNQKVYNIRIKWLRNDELDRHMRYTYNEMMDPNKKNWYGLKFPNEKDYQ